MRVMEGGHDVPIPKIIDRYYKSIANCVEAIPWLDRIYFYDNSFTDKDPALMFRISDGKIVKIYGKMISWVKNIANSVYLSDYIEA